MVVEAELLCLTLDLEETRGGGILPPTVVGGTVRKRGEGGILYD